MYEINTGALMMAAMAVDARIFDMMRNCSDEVPGRAWEGNLRLLMAQYSDVFNGFNDAAIELKAAWIRAREGDSSLSPYESFTRMAIVVLDGRKGTSDA